jgi:hypothetical protein
MSAPSPNAHAGDPARSSRTRGEKESNSKKSATPNKQVAQAACQASNPSDVNLKLNFELQTQAYRGFQNIEQVQEIMGGKDGSLHNNHDNANNADNNANGIGPSSSKVNSKESRGPSSPFHSKNKTSSEKPDLGGGEFDEARELFVRQQMLKMGVDASGMPVDPKLVTFGGKSEWQPVDPKLVTFGSKDVDATRMPVDPIPSDVWG